MVITPTAGLKWFAILIVLGIAVAGVALWFKALEWRAVAVTLLAGAAVGAAVVRGVLMETVIITSQELTEQRAAWLSTKVTRFLYSDVARIYLWREVPSDRPEDVWYVCQKNGDSQRINPGELWDANSEAVVRKLRTYGVDVQRLERTAAKFYVDPVQECRAAP